VKISDLRERSNADLEQLQQELARELWKSRFNNYTNQLDDTAKISRTRRSIAQIKTILTERARGLARGVQVKDATVAAAERAAKPAKAKKAAPVEEVEETETAAAAPEEAAPKKRATKKKAEAAEEKPKKKAPAKKKKAEE
jgi:large subunit ribosomal protein L29